MSAETATNGKLLTTRLSKQFIKVGFRKKRIIKEDLSHQKYEWPRDSFFLNARENG